VDVNALCDSVAVYVCVDEVGKLKQDPTIVHSSGKAWPDRSAVNIAASGSAYYLPDATSNGSPRVRLRATGDQARSEMTAIWEVPKRARGSGVATACRVGAARPERSPG
jgi:hypothetical protein